MHDEYCKLIESSQISNCLVPGTPVFARIDGRCFHKFTENMYRPFDLTLMNVMDQVAKSLLVEWDAKIAYVQSDEISLVFESTPHDTFPHFNGRVQKLTSLLASSTTAKFSDLSYQHRSPTGYWGKGSSFLPSPQFDCRIWQAPREYLTKYLIWRQEDAIRSSINMCARYYLTDSNLDGVNCETRKTMLLNKGFDWDTMDSELQSGRLFRKVEMVKTFESLEDLPPQHDALRDTNLAVTRKVPALIQLPRFKTIRNLPEVVLDGVPVFTN